MIHFYTGSVDRSTDIHRAAPCFDDTLSLSDTQWNQYTPQGNLLCHLVYTIQYTARLSYFTGKWIPSHWHYKGKQYTYIYIYKCADLTDLSMISRNWISKIKLQCSPGRPERPGAISSTGYSHRLPPHNSHRKHSLRKKFLGIWFFINVSICICVCICWS